MNLPSRVEFSADATDAPIHHVRWRHHVGAGLGMAERLLRQHFQRLVVQHVACFVDQAILTVTGVRIERDVGDYPEIREFTLQRLDRARNQAIFVECLFGAQRLQRDIDHRKQRQRRNAQIDGTLGSFQQEIE